MDAKVQPVEDVMGRIATVWLELLHREADLSTILFGEGLIDPEIGSVINQVIEEGAAGIEQFLDTNKQVGEITALVDTKTVAHMYMASILMFFLRYRHLQDEDWKIESEIFANNLRVAWLRMVTP
jgi:hypothetical protein